MPPGLGFAPILLLAALLLVPGTGITLALQPPGSASLPVRIALAFAFGYAAIAFISFVLALLHALTLGLFLGAFGVFTVGVWALALRRGKQHLRAIGEDIKREWTRYVTFLAVLAGTLAVRVTYVPIVNFVPTTLRYWADGIEIADAHGIPSTTLQWGQLLRPTTSKVILNTFDATMSFVLGRGPLVPTGALLFVASFALVFGAYALAEELGFRMLAPILPVLLFVNDLVGNTELTSDLRQNIAENWGRLVMIAALILAVRALKPSGTERAGPMRDALAAGVMFGVAAGTHLIPTVVGLAFAGGYALMRMIVDHGVTRVLRTSAAALAVALVVAGIVLVLPKGDLGFQGAGGDKGYDALRTELGLPATFDPTLYLVFGNVDRASKAYPYSPKNVLSDYAYQALNRNAREESVQRLGWVKALLPTLLALLGVVILLIFGDADLRAVAGTSVILMLLLIGAGMAFAARYDVYALETFGNRRLFNYVPIPFALVLIAVGELWLRWLGRAVGSPQRRRWVQPAVAGVLSVAVAAVLMPSARVPELRINGAASDLALVDWLRQHDPCDGRILADRRTLATFEAFDGRPGVLEGMGPHVRPDVLEIALKELFRAGYFFQDPAAGLPYLREKGVAYVVETYHIIGGWRRLETPDPAVMAKVPFLKKVFGNDAGTIYQVSGFEPNPKLPKPADQPGYCKTPLTGS
jgi:hypothetical protein